MIGRFAFDGGPRALGKKPKDTFVGSLCVIFFDLSLYVYRLLDRSKESFCFTPVASAFCWRKEKVVCSCSISFFTRALVTNDGSGIVNVARKRNSERVMRSSMSVKAGSGFGCMDYSLYRARNEKPWPRVRLASRRANCFLSAGNVACGAEALAVGLMGLFQ